MGNNNSTPVETYLNALAQIRNIGAGTPETTYYPAISNLINGVGSTLSPKVFCLNHVSGKQAGIPDFGFFELPTSKRSATREWREGIAPERGVLEAKGISQNIEALVASNQVQRQYLPAFGTVLVTNLWQFRLVTTIGVVDSFDLADTRPEFIALLNGPHPKNLVARFKDFLQRCLLTPAPLKSPAQLAFFLASYARDALVLLEERADLPALAALRRSMEESLELSFDAKDGAHLFRSTLVQTLFYGLFSAWIVEARAGRATIFNWRAAQWSLKVPIARFLFQQIATPEALEPLGIVPLLDAASRALARVEHGAFFRAFRESEAVQYFYEPFLEYFDPKLRKELGVWYTPPEIVEYMVERVDRKLRSELAIADGLADNRVVVLDPCCGTGSFLVAVLVRIAKTLAQKGVGALAAIELKRAAMRRIHGFEIMTAPLVIAHWQIGEFLDNNGATLGQDERASVFLTNALTGWTETGEKPPIPGFEALSNERSNARHVKRDAPILVVIGNPPYNAFAGTSPAAEGDLVRPYKDGLQTEWGIKKFNLDDLFVRFFRVAERRIADGTGKGVIAYITNFSFLSGASYVVMRRHLFNRFDSIWIDCMNGDSRETGKQTPDGLPDPSIFSTENNRAGIRVGTAITLLVRSENQSSSMSEVNFRHFWGQAKRLDLLNSLDVNFSSPAYERLSPSIENRFLMRPGGDKADYALWPEVAALSAQLPFNGPIERRGMALIDDDKEKLANRVKKYFDFNVTNEEILKICPPMMMVGNRIDGPSDRSKILQKHNFNEARIIRFTWKPFDVKWCYLDVIRPLFSEPSPELIRHLSLPNNIFFITRDDSDTPFEGPPSWITRGLGDYDLLRGHARFFPSIIIKHEQAALSAVTRQDEMFDEISDVVIPNLSSFANDYLAELDVPADEQGAVLVWRHAAAITFSRAYLAENAAGIRQGWPRIPMPANAALLRASAALGEKLTSLLDPDTPIDGITSGSISPILATIGVPRSGEQMPDFSLTAGWGNRTTRKHDDAAKGEQVVIMPGKGSHKSRSYAESESATAAEAAILGTNTRDIYLNETAFWSNIPDQVWETHIGGYQVIKKWLSYREHSIINRPLTPEEVRHVMETARRIAAILLLGPELDANFRACAAAHWTIPVARAGR